MKLFATILSTLAGMAANMGTQACLYFILDEPKMPQSLLNK